MPATKRAPTMSGACCFIDAGAMLFAFENFKIRLTGEGEKKKNSGFKFRPRPPTL